MATESPFADKIERVKALIKGYLQEAPFLLQVYITEQMGEDIGAGAFRNTPKGQALKIKPPRNTTNQLRFVTNRLGRALTPNESGNIANVVQKGDVYFIEYGISLKEVPYARVHEYGWKERNIRARPYLRTGFDAFTDKEVPRFYKRLAKELEK